MQASKLHEYIHRPSLYVMLDNLAKGHNTPPRRRERCIIADIDVKTIPRDVGGYSARLNGFRRNLADFFLRELEFVGVENHCIRVYLEPIEYNKMLREEMRVQADENVEFFHEQMARFDISRLFVFGVTLVIER